MDTALTQSIVRTSATMNQHATADAVGVAVLKKAMDVNAATASTLIETLLPQPALATEGALGTQVNTYA